MFITRTCKSKPWFLMVALCRHSNPRPLPNVFDLAESKQERKGMEVRSIRSSRSINTCYKYWMSWRQHTPKNNCNAIRIPIISHYIGSGSHRISKYH